MSELCSLGTLTFINIINNSLDRMRTECYSLQTTYLIYEAFETLFPTASLIFTAVKLLH